MSLKCLFGHDLEIDYIVAAGTTLYIHCKKCNKWWNSTTGHAWDSFNGMWQPGGDHKDLSEKEIKKCWDEFNYQTYIDSNNYSAIIKIIDDNKNYKETARAILALLKMPNSPLVTIPKIEKWLFYDDLLSSGGGFLQIGKNAITALAQKYASDEILPVLSQYVEKEFYGSWSTNAQSANCIYQILQFLAANGSERALKLLMEGIRKAGGDARLMAINAAFIVEWFPELTEALLDAVKDLIKIRDWKTDAVYHYDIRSSGGMGSPVKNGIAKTIQAIDEHNGNNNVEQRFIKIFEEIRQNK